MLKRGEVELKVLSRLGFGGKLRGCRKLRHLNLEECHNLCCVEGLIECVRFDGCYRLMR